MYKRERKRIWNAKKIVSLRKDKTGKKKKISVRRDKLQKGKEENGENEERMVKAQGKRYPEAPLCHNCSKRTKAAKNSGNGASHSETLTIKTKGDGKGEVCIGE